MATATMPWVDARPFRAHLHHLMATGDLSAAEVATLAGVSPRLTDALLHGRAGRALRRVSPASARALLTVTAYQARTLRSRQVPAEEPRGWLHRLLEDGAALEELAATLEVDASVLAGLADGSRTWCNGLLAVRLVTALRAFSARAASALPERTDQQQEEPEEVAPAEGRVAA